METGARLSRGTIAEAKVAMEMEVRRTAKVMVYSGLGTERRSLDYQPLAESLPAKATAKAVVRTSSCMAVEC